MKLLQIWLLISFISLIVTRYNDYQCGECFGKHIVTCTQDDCKCLYHYKWCLIDNKFLNGTRCYLGMYKEEYMDACIISNCTHCYIASPYPIKSYM